MTRRAHWGGLPLMLAPFGAWALGLGDIELRSALNQPLDADIELVSVTPEELADLRVALADPATFERYGLDRPGFLGRLSFGVGRDNVGRNVIRVTSIEPITEPFVTVLVEATWPRGRLLREYTVLLDPPVMLPAEAAVEPVRPAATRLPEPTQPAAVIERPAPVPASPPEPRAEPAPTPVAPVTSPRPMPAPAPAPVAGVAESPAPPPAGAYGPVQRGDTLWGIASRYRPTGITMNQMMVAIYEANPAAFAGNMNVLREGASLVMPSDAVLTARSAADATQEAIRQTAEWEGGAQQQARLRLLPPEIESTSTNVGTADPAAVAAAGGPVETPVFDPVDAADATGAGGEPVESERILSIEDAALSNLQQQLAEEADIADVDPVVTDAPAGLDALVEPGVDLEAEALLTEEPLLADEADLIAAEEPAEADTSVDAVTEDPVVAPPPRAVTQAVSTSSTPSLVSQIIGWLMTPLLWMVAGLLLLVGAGFVYLRSRQADDVEDVTGRWESLDGEIDEDFEAREATDRLRSQVRVEDDTILVEEQHTQELPEPERTADELFAAADDEEEVQFEGVPDVDLDDDLLAPPAPTEVAETVDTVETVAPTAEKKVSPDATMSSQTVINLDQADPIAEADFHMAYGLYDQAADLVSKALETDPKNRELRLKLLEVYFVWGNRESFLESARALRAAIGDKPDSDWDKVVIMGKQICPDESLFAEAAGGLAESVDLDLAAGDAPALDLAFDDQSGEGLDLDLGDADDTASVTLELDAADGDGSSSDALDLDIGAQTAAGLESAFFEPEPPQDDSAKTSPNLDLDGDAETQEAPTVEAFGPDAPTIESPTIDDTMRGPVDLPTLEQPGLPESTMTTGEQTAEIDLDDLGLDMSDLSSLDETPADDEHSLLDAEEDDADVLSATGVTQVLSAGDRPSDDDVAFTSTEVLPRGDDDTAATAQLPSAEASVRDGGDDDFGLDLDLDELSAALDGGDTVEQPSVPGVGGGNGLDLDVGLDASGDDEPTATEQLPLDAQTLTEVGTKLDLARAYIDMGDPDGARSILKEVLDEGDSTQQKEAKGLIEALGT